MTTATQICSGEDSSRYAWADHLIWMEGGEPVETEAEERVWSGLTLAFSVALAAGVGGLLLNRAGWPIAKFLDPILISMLLGLLWGNISGKESLIPGISLAVRRFLPWGIILLGARMDFAEALGIGAPGLILSALVVAFAMLLLFWLGKALGLDSNLAWLLGVGTGICGGTAIVAIAPILKAKDRDIIVCVGLVTLIGLGAMLILPAVAKPLGLSEVQFGMLAGLTIHQTPQVIAAGFAYGEESGQVATVAKLARVCLLVPVALLIGWWMTRSEAGKTSDRASSTKSAWYRMIPGFAIGFLVMAGAQTLGLLPEVEIAWNSPLFGTDAVTTFGVATVLKYLSGLLLAMGMVGVGFQTRLSQGRDIGIRVVLASLTASIAISLTVLILVKMFF